MPTPRSRLGVIFLTVFLDLVGFGIILPILPYYAQRFGAQGLGFGLLIGVYSLMQFLSTALLGRLSDRVGRRPVILATTLISAAGYTLFATAGSYTVLFVARLISGFSGGNIAAAQAYVADITPPADRSRGMGLIGAAFGLGFTVGPAIGGIAGHYGGPVAPMVVAAGLSLVNFVLAYLILPESLRPEHRVRRELWDFGHLVEALAHRRIRPLMVVWALVPFAFAGYTVALPLHAGAMLGWREKELGLFFVLVGVTAAVVQGYLFGKIARRVGDRPLVIAGTFGMALGIAVVPVLESSAALYAWTIVLAFSNSVMSPATNGLLSSFAGPSEQGAMLGAAQAFAALGRFAGPEAVGGVYDGVGPPAAFMTAGAVMAAAGLVALRIERLTPAPAVAPAAGDGGHVAAP